MANNNTKTDTRVFKMTNFSPIGFKADNYPVQYCSLCRGYLNEVCSTCMENGNESCAVGKFADTYYHNHCHSLMNSDSKKKPAAKKAYYDDDDEDM